MRNLFAPKEPVFTTEQFDRLSNIFDGAGQVGLGTVVLGQLFDKESFNLFVLGSGVTTVLALWTISILLTKRTEVSHYG